MREHGMIIPEKQFATWLRLHTYWWQLEEQVLLIARKFEEANDAVRKIHVRVDEYHGHTLCEMLKRYCSNHWDHAFKKWHAGIKSTIDLGAQPYFHCTARHYFYRWYRSARLYPIPENPCDAWRPIHEENRLRLVASDHQGKLLHNYHWQDPLNTHTPRKPPSKKAPLKQPPIEPANKKRKKRSRGKSASSEVDENIEEDHDDEEADDVFDIDSQPIENLDGEDDPLGDLPDPLLRIDIAEELWDHVDDHTCGTEPDPQHLFVLIDLRELQREIGDGQCQHAGLGSIRRLLGSLTRMGVMDAQAALGGCNYAFAIFPQTLDQTQVLAVFLHGTRQYIIIVQEAQDNGFELTRTMYLHINAPMFILRKEYIEPTQTLLLAMFVRGCDIGLVQRQYNRTAGQEAASDDGFGERVDMLWEPSASDAFKPWRTYHNGKPLCPGVEKSTQFSRWLLGTSTEMGDAVMDIFAGIGGVASQCLTLHRHCISIEVDRQLERTCLAPLQRVPYDLPFKLFFGEVFKALQRQQAMTQEREFYDASSSHAHMHPPSVRHLCQP
ncbi:hypothetical protein L7F22_007130 [Adiantum nelumboides]|nr:hypothetical protein [Adiantum nelumboides]